jgi:CRP-like cAMP-binding protein
MTLTEKMFMLRSVAGFERLHDTELAVIAEIATERRFGPGDTVCMAGSTSGRAYVVVQGSIVTPDGTAVPGIVGVGSVLFDLPAATTLCASRDQGALCLSISRSHFFTVAHQCPALLCGLLEVKDLPQ